MCVSVYVYVCVCVCVLSYQQCEVHMGVTRLRLQRLGRKDHPFYRIIAVDSRKKRDTGKPLEFVSARLASFSLLLVLSCCRHCLGVLFTVSVLVCGICRSHCR